MMVTRAQASPWWIRRVCSHSRQECSADVHMTFAMALMIARQVFALCSWFPRLVDGAGGTSHVPATEPRDV